jgi:hypothetical protein
MDKPDPKELIRQTKMFMEQYDLTAAQMKQIGKYAVEAIGSNEAYQEFREGMLKAGILSEDELPEEKNYMVLMAIGTMGELAGEV